MFSGENTNDVNKLEWVTNVEINNDYFQVERSSDGVLWNSIGTLDGMGSTQETQRYSLNDVTYTNSMNYYRLKQVDNDGKFSYSKIISLLGGGLNFALVKHYPNPILFLHGHHSDRFAFRHIGGSTGSRGKGTRNDRGYD